MMRRVRLLMMLVVVAVTPAAGQQRAGAGDAPATDPWFGTFSIIAFDPATNQLGVATQSRAFGAGAAVPYAIPGRVMAHQYREAVGPWSQYLGVLHCAGHSSS